MQHAPSEALRSLAEHHLREAEARVARQEALVAELTLHGHDTSLSEALLDTMRATLELMRDHVKTERAAAPTGTAKPPR